MAVFTGFIANDLTVDERAPKGLIQITRILWTFARLIGNSRIQPIVPCAEHGSLSARPLRGSQAWRLLLARWICTASPRKRSRWSMARLLRSMRWQNIRRAAGSQESLDHAIALYRLLEEHHMEVHPRRLLGRTSATGRQRHNKPWTPQDLPVAESINRPLASAGGIRRSAAAWDDDGLANTCAP